MSRLKTALSTSHIEASPRGGLYSVLGTLLNQILIVVMQPFNRRSIFRHQPRAI